MTPLTLRLDAGVDIPGVERPQIAASVWLPVQSQQAPAALVCLPGGYMNRRYFDLRPPAVPDDGRYSFAAQMVARGHVVMALDPLGIGDSSAVADGYTLTPQRIAAANAHATDTLLARLRDGTLADGVAALPELRSVGVGHSMGALLTVLQQAARHQHAAVALLGFSTRGLPQFLPEAARALSYEAQRAQVVPLARQFFVESTPALQPGASSVEFYGSARAERSGVAALKAATDRLLPVPAYLSMIAGNVAPEAASLDVPVFIGLGARDMAGPPHDVPAAFPGSFDVTLQILADAGHSHFLFPSRVQLFDRLDGWLRSALPAPTDLPHVDGVLTGGVA